MICLNGLETVATQSCPFSICTRNVTFKLHCIL